MTIATRRKIFYTLVALFILIGGAVVFYAQGWRFDFAARQFEKIGGIYVRSFPEGASIFLNGKPVTNQSGFLSPGTLISNLLPKTYALELKAADYDSWRENAAVAPSFVTQFKYAVLVPEKATQAASATAGEFLAANAADESPDVATSTAMNPFDANKKIVARTIAGNSKIFIFDAAQATTTASASVSGRNLTVKWITAGTAGVLQRDGSLYLFDTNAAAGQTATQTNVLKKLADGVRYFAATDDGSAIAALEKKSLEIFASGGENNYYRFNLPAAASVARVIWYQDRNHLFVVYPDHVSFLDLADAGLTNFITIARGAVFLYDPRANTLYVKDPTGMFAQYEFPS